MVTFWRYVPSKGLIALTALSPLLASTGNDVSAVSDRVSIEEMRPDAIHSISTVARFI